MMLRVLVLAGLSALTVSAPVAAQDLRGPREQPPASFRGQQFVDSRGCVFLRGGVAGSTTWVPRVSANRRQLCGFPPSFTPAPPAVAEAPRPARRRAARAIRCPRSRQPPPSPRSATRRGAARYLPHAMPPLRSRPWPRRPRPGSASWQLRHRRRCRPLRPQPWPGLHLSSWRRSRPVAPPMRPMAKDCRPPMGAAPCSASEARMAFPTSPGDWASLSRRPASRPPRPGTPCRRAMRPQPWPGRHRPRSVSRRWPHRGWSGRSIGPTDG